jgi:hypothetical protein
MKWWVDASFGFHPDLRSHTGGVLTLGRRAVYSTSTRQMLNTRSSTEGELVGVNDVLPQILWTKYFPEQQGYASTNAIIYQDNKSAMLLENNGRACSSKQIRHINFRCFFVADRIRAKEVRIEYCPTGSRLVDFFTQPLQGTPFRKFRADIMDLDPETNSSLDHRSVLGLENDRTETELKTGADKGWTLVTTRQSKRISRRGGVHVPHTWNAED